MYETSDKVWDYIQRHSYCAVSGDVVPHNVGVHHWKTVGSGGTDEDSNLDRLMPKYHREAHLRGIKYMAIKYGLFKPRQILIDRGRWNIFEEKEFINNNKNKY